MPAQSYSKITSKEVIGYMFQEAELAAQASWVDAVSTEFVSTQSSELYAGLGTTPQMREWIGGKDVKSFTEQSIRITNKDFESTVRINVKDLDRDKTGFVRAQIAGLMSRAMTHKQKLLSDLILAGTGTTLGACYDGKAFYATNHVVGSSGTINNKIDSDISTLATATHGSTTSPSIGEFSYSFLAAIQQMYGFKDDQGEPSNENALEFVAMVPVGLSVAATAAASAQYVAQGESNILKSAYEGIKMRVVVNPRLTWTDKFAVFRSDGSFKSLISQVEEAETFKALAEGSDYEFDENAHKYSVEKRGNVGYGRFDRSVLVTLT